MHREEGMILPAIRLLSSQNGLLSPFDHGGYHPSIRLRSSAITLLLSPHTPCGSQAPLSAGRRASHDPEKGKGREGPQSQSRTSNARFCTGLTISTAPDEQSPAAMLAWCGFRHEVTVTSVTDGTTDRRNLLPGASRRSNRVTQPLEMLHFQPIARCLPIIGGIYARVAAASFTLVERKMRRRDRSRNLKFSRYLGIGRPSRPGRGGVGGLSGSLGIIDLLALLRGGSEKSGRPPKENLVNK
jgi:hypothetical protein